MSFDCFTSHKYAMYMSRLDLFRQVYIMLVAVSPRNMWCVCIMSRFAETIYMTFVELNTRNMCCTCYGWISLDNFTWCHTETAAADQTCTSPSRSILTPGQQVRALQISRQLSCRISSKTKRMKSLL